MVQPRQLLGRGVDLGSREAVHNLEVALTKCGDLFRWKVEDLRGYHLHIQVIAQVDGGGARGW